MCTHSPEQKQLWSCGSARSKHSMRRTCCVHRVDASALIGRSLCRLRSICHSAPRTRGLDDCAARLWGTAARRTSFGAGWRACGVRRRRMRHGARLQLDHRGELRPQPRQCAIQRRDLLLVRIDCAELGHDGECVRHRVEHSTTPFAVATVRRKLCRAVGVRRSREAVRVGVGA